MQRKYVLFLLILLLCLFYAGGALAGSSENYRMDWMVPLSGAGGETANSTHYTVSYTIGQSASGYSSSTGYRGTLGFWYQQASDWLIMLPQLFRNLP